MLIWKGVLMEKLLSDSGKAQDFGRAQGVKATAVGALLAAIDRVEAAVAAETDALRKRVAVDLREFDYRKSQALLDLTRAGRNLAAGPIDEAVVERLRKLRLGLDDNIQLLSTHLHAVREISELISQSMLDADSDGTYCLQVVGKK